MEGLYFSHVLPFIKHHSDGLLQVLIVFTITLMVHMLLPKFIHRYLYKDVSSPCWKDALFSSPLPLKLLIWLVALSFVLSALYKEFKLPLFGTLLEFRSAGFILVGGWLLLRIKRYCSPAFVKHVKLEHTAIANLVDKLLTAFIIVGTVLLILPSLGVNVNGLVAFGGIGGIVMGFAAKDMLSNYFGAIMLHVDRPFMLGDWISLPAQNIQGIVEYIGWRQVIIRTFDKRQVFIPNSLFSNMILENPSRMTNRRINETIRLRYADISKASVILEQIRVLLAGNEGLDQEAGIVVNLTAFGTYSIDILLTAYTKTTDWKEYLSLKEKMLLDISDIVTRNSAAFAFPTQLLEVKQLQGSDQSLSWSNQPST